MQNHNKQKVSDEFIKKNKSIIIGCLCSAFILFGISGLGVYANSFTTTLEPSTSAGVAGVVARISEYGGSPVTTKRTVGYVKGNAGTYSLNKEIYTGQLVVSGYPGGRLSANCAYYAGGSYLNTRTYNS